MRPEWAARRWGATMPRGTGSMGNDAQLFAAVAARRIVHQLVGNVGVALPAGARQLEDPRDLALAEHRTAEDFGVHVSALREEAGVLDIADDLHLVHAVAGA